MGFWEVAYLAWPFMGLGAAVVLLILLFATDKLRANTSVPRWRDPAWLAWAVACAYLLHVFEEYGCHIEGGQFVLVTTFEAKGISDMFGGIPHMFFPYMNIMLTWVAMPVAAALAKKHPVIGLSGIGFELLNGFTHIGGGIAQGLSLLDNAGVFTGVLVFIPLYIVVAVQQKRHGILSKKGLAIATVSGIAGHILLFAGYGLNLAFGNAATYIAIPIIAFSPLIVAWLLCSAFKVRG